MPRDRGETSELRRRAEDAQQRGQVVLAAELWAELVAQLGAESQGYALYQQGCCIALQGHIHEAAAILKRAVQSGMRDLGHIDSDPDLECLRQQRSWTKFRDDLRILVETWEETLGDPRLRRELLELAAQDQNARRAWLTSEPDAEVRLNQVDRKNTERMRTLIDESGWPGSTVVGADGTRAAWLLIQHADHDPALQARCLPLLDSAVRAGESNSLHYAYLFDRVAVNHNRPQKFGTQFDVDGRPFPIESIEFVDERRREVGLGSLANGRSEMQRTYPSQAPQSAKNTAKDDLE